MSTWDYFIVTFQIGSDYFYKQYKNASIMITVLAFIFNIIAFFNGEIISALILTAIILLPLFFILGIYVQIKMYPHRKRMEKMQQMFLDIGLMAPDGQTPQYVGEEESEYVKIMEFKTVIPLEKWYSKKSLLETYWNSKIINIKNLKDDNNIVDVFIENKPLSENVLWDDEHTREKDYYCLGIDHFGYVVFDLNSTPHTFIAGETGSGKSNILKCLIYQSIIKSYTVKLIDFKRGVSFSAFSDIVEIYSDYDRIQMLLESLVKETNDRLDLLRENRVEDIKDYNRLDDRHMERIVVFIDELAELMKSSDKEANKAITASLETLTRLSRAVGINLIMGLQRPDSTIINGQIKNNVSMRVCGRFVDPEPSRIMLGNDMATKIPQIKGRFILRDGDYREFQAFRITDDLMDYINHKLYQYNKSYQKREPKEAISEPSQTPNIQDSVIDFNFDDII